ncbi:MAG: AarF/ABC1/UbiB kinase family protein [Myxococcota bacterium]|nr:AarF/ABC1/UbiB kinase family protein [Myxococcota bacterium]
MARDWKSLGGDRGRKVETGRLGRALKLGGLATKVSGSFLKRQIKRIGGQSDDLEGMAGAALDNARQIVEVMGEMKGAAMKVGQLLSTDPDILDPEFAQRLKTLQNSAPPMDFETLSAQVEAALDQPIEAVFKFFDPEPIGSASIGQVHRAQLFDGREVAVKIQYPGIAGSIESDVRNLGSLLKLGRVFISKERADQFVEEARDAILAEADYTQEARNLERFRAHFKDFEGVRIPEPVLAYTRPNLLVMEFIEGQPFDVGVNALPDPHLRNELADRFLRVFVYMFHDLHELHADPHPGNFLLDQDQNIVLLDFGCIRTFDPFYSDGVLRILRAFWDDDMVELSRIYRELKFGTETMTYPSHDVLRAYHNLILAPMKHHGPFRFADFKVHSEARAFVRKHMSILKLVPPRELLLYLRVVAGMKGMMTRIDAEVHVREGAEEVCERRGI